MQSWCCVQNPLWNMPQGLRWSDWEDTGASTQRSEEGLNIRQCVPVGSCGTGKGWIPCYQVGGSRGGESSSPLPAEICFRSIAHRDRAAQNEPRWRPSAPSVQPTSPSVTLASPHWHGWIPPLIGTCVCLFLSTLVYIYIINDIISVISLLLHSLFDRFWDNIHTFTPAFSHPTMCVWIKPAC